MKNERMEYVSFNNYDLTTSPGPSNSAGGSQTQLPSQLLSQSQSTQLQSQPQTQTDLRIHRQHSSDSVSSITSATSLSSVGSNLELDAKNKKKRKNWVSSLYRYTHTHSTCLFALSVYIHPSLILSLLLYFHMTNQFCLTSTVV